MGRRFHHFLRRVPHTVNSAARGSVLPRPVGVGVLDDPCLRLPPAPRRRTSPVGDGVPDVPPSRSPPALPRSASPCRGGVPPPPGRRDDRRPRVAAPAPLGSASSTTLSFVHRRPHGGAGTAGGGAARKGGTPGEGSPFDPLLRFISTRRVPRAAARGQGSAPGPRPLFCKKAGQKTFTGLDCRQPKPLAPGASDSIRPRSGHLSGRVAAPTRVGEAGGPRNLTGAPPPKKRFSLGLHPVSLGKTKEMGWKQQHQPKVQQDKTASSSHPPPPGPAAQTPGRS